MKQFLIALYLMCFSMIAVAESAAINIFSGQGQLFSGGATAVQSTNSAKSGAVFGTSGGTHTSTAINDGRATALINPQGSVVSHEQGSGASSRGGNYSFGNSDASGFSGGLAGGLSGAQSTFQTIGLGIVVLP